MAGHHACWTGGLYPSRMYNFDCLYSNARDNVGEGTFCHRLLIILMFLIPHHNIRNCFFSVGCLFLNMSPCTFSFLSTLYTLKSSYVFMCPGIVLFLQIVHYLEACVLEGENTNLISLPVRSLTFHCNNIFLFVPSSSCLKILWHIWMNLFLNLERCYLEEAQWLSIWTTWFSVLSKASWWALLISLFSFSLFIRDNQILQFRHF